MDILKKTGKSSNLIGYFSNNKIGIVYQDEIFYVVSKMCYFLKHAYKVCLMSTMHINLLMSIDRNKSLIQHHSLKASILWLSAFFMVQLSHSYMTTRKIIVLTMQTFVGKVMSLLFNMLSRFAIAFLPRSKHHHLQ